jgi:predicted molibdopterin-dependent oxidoreductase YjgC
LTTARVYATPPAWLPCKWQSEAQPCPNIAAEVAKNDVFIITGSNTTENHPIIAIQMKAAIRKKAGKIDCG